MKYQYYLFFLVLLTNCTKPKNKKAVQTRPVGIENKLFNNKISLYLDQKYERLNLQELDIILKSGDVLPFVKNIFNPLAISYYSKVNKNVYFFVDTISKKDILIFQKNPRHFYIGKDNANSIMSEFSLNLKKLAGKNPSEIECGKISYGANSKCSYLHFQLELITDNFKMYSNCLPFSTKTGTYIIQNYSTQNHSLNYLKNQIIFK